MFLLTLYVKSHSGFCSISNVIMWDTFVFARVLRLIDVIESIVTIAVLAYEAAIEIELVNWYLFTAAITMHLNVTVSPSVTVFCAALVVSLAPSGLSKNINQIKISITVYFTAHTFRLVINHNHLFWKSRGCTIMQQGRVNLLSIHGVPWAENITLLW